VKASSSWIGFLKVGLFAVPVYALALFIGSAFGAFLGKLSMVLRIAAFSVFLLMASAYLQILKIQIINESDNSLKSAIKDTKQLIADKFLRIILGNISVMGVAFIIILIFWLILKFIKGQDWNIIYTVIIMLIQQAIILIICFAQVIRINFNSSILEKGD
jgi:hypothetical protein